MMNVVNNSFWSTQAGTQAPEPVTEPERATAVVTAPTYTAHATARELNPSEVDALAPAAPERRVSDRFADPDQAWTWEQLRDYVCRMVEKTTRAHYRRDPLREAGIFKGFVARFGAAAGPIAVWVFETQPQPGMWMNSPVTPSRFAKGSDAFFAQPIVARLAD